MCADEVRPLLDRFTADAGRAVPLEALWAHGSLALGDCQPGRSDLDLVALTSFSEGQPLVMLEAYACGVPVLATDVGACREMIEGRTAEDRALGASGIVCPVASPSRTAEALVLLAQDARLRRRMGHAGQRRVTMYYQRRTMLASYRALYGALVTS